MRPNERFSGRGHARHLCRGCARLPAEEVVYRQAERDIDRLLHAGVHIPRRLRPQFDRFLAHSNARVRELARSVLAEHERALEELRRMRDEEHAWRESVESFGEDVEAASDGESSGPREDRPEDPDDDLPF